MCLIKQLNLFLALGVTCLMLTSCGRHECSDTNPVFSRLSPASQAYKAELAKLLRTTDTDKLAYWLDRYFVEDGNEYLTVHIQGDGLCAQSDLLVTDWQKLSGIRTNKGAGYSGAELEGLKVSVQEDAGKFTFVFVDVERIVD